MLKNKCLLIAISPLLKRDYGALCTFAHLGHKVVVLSPDYIEIEMKIAGAKRSRMNRSYFKFSNFRISAKDPFLAQLTQNRQDLHQNLSRKGVGIVSLNPHLHEFSGAWYLLTETVKMIR